MRSFIMSNTIGTKIYIPKDLEEFLTEDAKDRDRSRNQHIKEILFDYRDKKRKEQEASK